LSSVGAEPSPSHASGALTCGAQPFPNAQQFGSIGAATRKAMHFEIIEIFSTDNALAEMVSKKNRYWRVGAANGQLEDFTLKSRAAQAQPS
jgi:hypothetical protein